MRPCSDRTPPTLTIPTSPTPVHPIPSPKAEPFKRWLAKVGYERLEEIENPELAAKRMRELYEQKGYPEDWIEKRLRDIAVRDELANEWKKRGGAWPKSHTLAAAMASLQMPLAC